MSQNWPTKLRKTQFPEFQKCLSVNQRTMFQRLKTYVQFASKMNDICAVKSIFLLHLKILYIWSFLVRKSFSVTESCWYPQNCQSPVLKNLQTGNFFLGRQKESIHANTFLSLIVQYLFGGTFTQFENSTEKRRLFVSAVSPVLVF